MRRRRWWRNEAGALAIFQADSVGVVRHNRTHHDILPDEVKDFDAIIEKAGKKLGTPMEPALPCVTRKHSPFTKTQRQKVAVSKCRRKTA